MKKSGMRIRIFNPGLGYGSGSAQKKDPDPGLDPSLIRKEEENKLFMF